MSKNSKKHGSTKIYFFHRVVASATPERSDLTSMPLVLSPQAITSGGRFFDNIKVLQKHLNNHQHKPYWSQLNLWTNNLNKAPKYITNKFPQNT